MEQRGPLTILHSYDQELTEEERRLNEEEWRPINILLDFSNMENTDEIARIYIEKTIMTLVKDRFTRMLYVRGEKIIPGFNGACNGDISVPSSFENPTTADLILFVRMIQEDSGYLAYATPCAIQASDRRPNIGLIMINQNNLEIGKDQIEDMVYILIHETFHVLAVSPSLYDLY